MTTTSADLEQLVWEEWLRALQGAYRLARAERLAELHGTRYRKYDERGVHVYSAEWGRIYGCEVLLPELADFRAITSEFVGPIGLRQAACDEAEREFALIILRERAA